MINGNIDQALRNIFGKASRLQKSEGKGLTRLCRAYFLLVLIVLHFPPQTGMAQEQVFVDIRGSVFDIAGRGIPFAHVISITTLKGSAADYYGRFRIFARPGDTLILTAMGFRNTTIPIPEYLGEGVYPLRITLPPDTLELSEAVITPWPETWTEFKHAFVNLDVPGDAPYLEIPSAAIRQAIRDARPTGGITLPGPVSLLYEAFSRNAKYRRKLEALQKESSRFETLRYRLGQNVLATIAGSGERDRMEAFVARCDLSDTFIASASDLQLITILLQCSDRQSLKNKNSSEK